VSDADIAVNADHLTKSYGRLRGIVDVSLTVAAGEVMGLVGVNGAGKTTFLRTLLDLIRPTSGTVSVFGHPSHRDSVAVRRLCTYLPGEFVVPARLTGHQTLRRYTFARSDVDSAAVDDLAQRLDLDLSRRVGDLSKGNRQKLALVLAFAPPARLLILDEPTSGLDPVLQRTFASLVSEAVGRGSTVLLSSHVMSEVEQIADRVALLRDGQLAAVDDIASLLTGSRRRGHVRPHDLADGPTIGDALSRLPQVSEVTVVDGLVTFACLGAVDPIVKLLAGFSIASLDLAHADLEDAFFSDHHATGRFPS
jgi:ABC-2 type transport system ATP-binding protein